MLWGGTTANRPNLATPSHRRSNRLTLRWNATTGSYDFTGWMEELMESKRVMADAVLLPNGKVVVLNGAGVSTALCGWCLGDCGRACLRGMVGRCGHFGWNAKAVVLNGVERGVCSRMWCR